MNKRFIVGVMECITKFEGTLEQAQCLTKYELNEILLAEGFQIVNHQILTIQYLAEREYENLCHEVKSVLCGNELKIRKVFITTEYWNERAELWESGAFYTYEIGAIV